MKLEVLLVLCPFVAGTSWALPADELRRSVQGGWTAADAGDAVTCVAQATCRDGSTVSCSSGGTCVGVDASCPSQRGYVTCGGTTTYCPPCLCSATVWCMNGTSVSCSGACGTVYSVQPSCPSQPGYVECNGQRTTCGPLWTCVKDAQCSGYCYPDPAWCQGGCCACW